MPQVAVRTGVQVGVEVVSTTPCRAIADMVIGVVVVTIMTVLVIVCQREQEARACTSVIVVSTDPRCAVVTTNQFSCVQLDDGKGDTFPVASTVESGCTSTMDTALVTHDPVLVVRS